MVQKYTSLYKDDPIAAELEAGIKGTDVYQGSPYALANVPEFEGMKYAMPDYNRYQDLYGLYMGGGFDAAQDDFVPPPAAPPASGDGGGGTGTGTPAGGDGTFIGGGATLEDAGGTYPGGYHSAEGGFEYTGTPTSDPFLASGAAGGARLPEDLGEITADDYGTPTHEDKSIIMKDISQKAGQDIQKLEDHYNSLAADSREQYMSGQATPESILVNQLDMENAKNELDQAKANLTTVIPGTVEPQAVKTILAPDGITYDAATGQPIYEDLDAQAAATDSILGTQDLVTQKDLEDNTSLLQKLGLPADFDLKKALIETGINLAAGVPISLIGKALGAVLPDRDPRQTALDEFYATGEGAQYMDPTSTNYIPGMENYNIVSGGGLYTLTGGKVGEKPTYGLQDAYQDRIDTIEKTLAEKYPDGDYSDTQLDERLAALKKAKADEFTMLDEVTDEMGDVQQDLTPKDKEAGIKIGDAAGAEEITKLNEEVLEARQRQGEQVQEIQRQEIARNDDDKDRQQRDTGVAKVDENRYETKSGDVYASAYEAAEKSDNGGGGGGGGKIVCTMMNESYGFGSFRNKIWLKHSKDLAPEYQRGYHKIFLPLVKLSKKNKLLKKTLEHIAVHRTIDIRQEARGKVHLLGRIYRKVLEPICYWVGKHAKR